MSNLEDLKNIIEGCKAGDRKSQQQIYELHYGKMLAICLRYTKDLDQAKDILQDGFLKVFTKITEYHGKGSFEGWVRRIVVNTCIDYFRKSKKDLILLGKNNSVEEFTEIEDEIDDFESAYDFTPAQVMDALQKLSNAYRLVFNMYMFEDMKHKDIAEKLGISVGTSKSNYAKAKMNLKKILYKEYKKTDG